MSFPVRSWRLFILGLALSGLCHPSDLAAGSIDGVCKRLWKQVSLLFRGPPDRPKEVAKVSPESRYTRRHIGELWDLETGRPRPNIVVNADEIYGGGFLVSGEGAMALSQLTLELERLLIQDSPQIWDYQLRYLIQFQFFKDPLLSHLKELIKDVTPREIEQLRDFVAGQSGFGVNKWSFLKFFEEPFSDDPETAEIDVARSVFAKTGLALFILVLHNLRRPLSEVQTIEWSYQRNEIIVPVIHMLGQNWFPIEISRVGYLSGPADFHEFFYRQLADAVRLMNRRELEELIEARTSQVPEVRFGKPFAIDYVRGTIYFLNQLEAFAPKDRPFSWLETFEKAQVSKRLVEAWKAFMTPPPDDMLDDL